MYNIGDKFIINGREFTIWLIELPAYHLASDDGVGICCDAEYINNNRE
jgi:hypothetical protein